MRWKLYSAGLIFAAASMAAAEDAPTGGNSLADRAVISSARQTRIRAQTAKTTDELSGIIDEFDRNGLGDDQDARMLRAVRDALSSLSDSQMQQVVALLDQARNAPSDDAAKTRSASAFATQKQIYAAMQQTLLAFQQQADLLDLSVQFAQLGRRQNLNFKETKHLALKTMNARDLDEGKSAELHVQQTEQDSIQQEVTARLDKLASLMKSVDPATAAQLSAVTQQVSPSALKISLSTASSELRQAHMTKAASVQRSAYKQLREFSRLARPAREVESVLTDAADQLGVTIKGYKVAMADLLRARGENTEENRITLDDEQGDLVDDVSDVCKDIETLANGAFATLSDAKETMQEARGASVNGAEAQKRALPKLISARQQILDEIQRRQLFAQMEQGSKLDRADAARDELAHLADQQRQIMTETREAHDERQTTRAATRQAALTDTLRAMQQEVAKTSPDMAATVEKAANSSQTANDKLADNKPREAIDPQQKTIDTLNGAAKQANNAVADVEQKQQELQQLQKERADLSKVAGDEQALSVQTAVAASNDQSAKPDAQAAAPPEANQHAPADAQPGEKTPAAASDAPDTTHAPASSAPKSAENNPAATDVKNDAAKPPAGAETAPNNPAPSDTQAGGKNAPAPSASTSADELKTPAPSARQLGNGQQALAKQTRDLQNNGPSDAADAAAPLKDAAQQMDAAAGQLGSNAAAPAQNPEHAAIDSLLKAQQAVDKKMDELKQQLGEPAAKASPIDQAAREVQQALQKIAAAQDNLKNDRPNAAGEQLQQAAAHVANAQNQGALPPGNDQQLSQAHDELGQGAAATGHGDKTAANADAQAAAGMLQQAMQQMQAAGADPGKTGPQYKPGQMAAGDPPKTLHASHIDTNGNRDAVTGGSAFNGLPERDRAAITQSGQEPTPAQYQSMVQQYMKNLADDSQPPAGGK